MIIASVGPRNTAPPPFLSTVTISDFHSIHVPRTFSISFLIVLLFKRARSSHSARSFICLRPFAQLQTFRVRSLTAPLYPLLPSRPDIVLVVETSHLESPHVQHLVPDCSVPRSTIDCRVDLHGQVHRLYPW